MVSDKDKLRKVKKRRKVLKKDINERNELRRKRKIQRPIAKDQYKDDFEDQNDQEILKNQNEVKDLDSQIKKLNEKIRLARGKRNVKVFSIIGLPMIMIIIISVLLFFLVSSMYIASSTATIAALANPKYRAELKANNELGSDEMTSIPESLLGSEPDLSASSILNSSKKKSNSNATDSLDGGSKEDNAKAIYKRYKTNLSKARIAGVLGNFELESHLDPHAYEGMGAISASFNDLKKVDFDPSKALGPNWASKLNASPAGYRNGHGGYTMGMGLAQWTGPRGYNLIHGVDDYTKLGQQLKFMDDEKHNGWNGSDSWSRWSSSSKNDVNNATNDFKLKYEGNANGTLAARSNLAQKWLNKMKGWD